MTEHIDESILSEVDRTQIIAVGVSEYNDLEDLKGPVQDIKKIEKMFVSSINISIYPTDRFLSIENPTKNQLSKTILDYVSTRSARGDILIFYFSGHGYVAGNGEFSLCMKDSIKGFDDSGILALSTLSFGEIVKSLSAVDVYPCFIFDACFSAASSKVGNINIGVQIEYETSIALGNSYAVLASSSPDAYSKETKEGGYFTQAFSESVLSGLPMDQNEPFVSLKNIPISIDKRLTQIGAPLSRLHIGHAFPEIAIAINRNYDPKIRTERFTRAYKDLLQYAWNEGEPRCFTMEEIRKELPSGYGNHRKFEYIWGLLENSERSDGKKCRSLTDKAISFIKGEITIHREMQKNPENPDEWIPSSGTEVIRYEEI